LIASVSGRVASIGPDSVVVEVGGVGLQVSCSLGTLATLRPGEVTTLSTSLIVREDSLTLYGFADADERAVFELLQPASGVGPRLAQAMLATHSPDALRRAVATEDLGALMLVSGVGKKGAQRIVLELKDKLGAPSGLGLSGRSRVLPENHLWRDQLQSALLGLGWSPREADDAVAHVSPEAEDVIAAGGEPDVGLLLRTALRSLSRA
jgi:Holliday junction DNA helicase RuvA